MTLCVAIRAANGLVAISDGMTVYFSASEEEPDPPPLLDAVKSTAGPEGQPWVLMYANRATYARRPISEVVADLVPTLGEIWTTVPTLGPLAELVVDYFWTMDNEMPATPLVEPKTGQLHVARFSGLLCGYTNRQELEVWYLDSQPAASSARLTQDAFAWIGCEAAADDAQAALTDAGSQPPEVRKRIGLSQHESIHDFDIDVAGRIALQALKIKATHEGSFWPRWGVGGQWVGHAITEVGATRLRD